MKQKLFFYVSLFTLFFCFFALSVFAANSDDYVLFKKANSFYEQHQYKKAISYYKKITKKDFANAALFYNIGTSYLKLNKIGYSLFWLEKAKFFAPLDSELSKNIQIAKSKVKDELHDKTIYAYLNGLFFICNIFSMKFLFYISVVIFYLLLIALVLKCFTYKFSVNTILARIIYISLISFVFFFLSFFWQYYKYNYLHTGYITADNVNLKNDFSNEANNIALLNDGTKVYINDQKNNFLHVKLGNGTLGWINKKFIVF